MSSAYMDKLKHELRTTNQLMQKNASCEPLAKVAFSRTVDITKANNPELKAIFQKQLDFIK